MLTGATPVYFKSEDKEFRQGEILSNVVQHSYSAQEFGVVPMTHTYAVLLSQDCDLLREFTERSQPGPRALNSILLYEARPATELSTFFPNAGRSERKRIFQNNDERYHYLQEVPKELDAHDVGLPALIVDFRRLFSMTPAELLHQCGLQRGAQRRCRLGDLYREHLQSRMAFYLQRVALPAPHHTPD